MKTIIVIILLLVPLISSHAIDKGPISKSTESYNIEFSTDPKFPVTGKDTHLDFIIKGKDNNLISDLNIKAELHRQGKTLTLDLSEEQRGHYSTKYNFNEAGDYEMHLLIGDEELETEFELELDSFGVSGWLRTSTIIIFLLILLGLMYKDCRR